jgi:WD40 repeat protein
MVKTLHALKLLKILSLFIFTDIIHAQHMQLSCYQSQIAREKILQVAIQPRELQAIILEYIDFWDIVQTLPCDEVIDAIAYTPSYIVGRSCTSLIIWQLRNSLFTNICKAKAAHTYPIQTIAISPDSKYIASGSGKEIKLWCLENSNLKNIQTFSTPAEISVIKFSKAGSFIVGALNNAYIIWKFDAFRCTEIQSVKISNCPMEPNTEIAALMQLVSISENKIKILLFVNNQFVLTQILHSQDSIIAVACSSERTYIAAGSRDGGIYLWYRDNNNTYIFQQKLLAHAEAITSLIFSRDEKYVTSLSDHSICIWQVFDNAWKCKFILKKENIIQALAFCRTGASFVNAENNIINIWRNSRQDLEMA